MSTAPSLYRRHRPRTFDDVVGQEHVVRTLSNAVEQDKLHHAYLFVGSRGTGKTSMAKILAACLNCSGTPEDPRPPGPTTQPCGKCESCRGVQTAHSLDVIEMDAASNNSVEDIRELRDAVQFAPVSGRYKVYILDEAHMLTTQAWNAFLKTLEEPPPSTIFVLATTEANKVLPTVVDRCHRFDFTRPSVEQLGRVVQRVADREQIAIPAEAVAILARHATGSFRDALGTLEQLVTYSGADIVVEDVLAVLGVADAELLFGALDAVASHDAPTAIRAAARLVDTGRDVSQFVRDLEAHARELLITQTLGSVPPELAVTPDRDARLAEQAKRVPATDVVRLIDLLAASLRATKDGADGRTQLELALVKAATPEVDASTQALLARLERLERALSAAAAVAPPPEPARSIAEPPPHPAPASPASPAAQPAPPSPEIERAVTPAAEPAAPDPPASAPPAPAPVPAAPAPEPVAPAMAPSPLAAVFGDERGVATQPFGSGDVVQADPAERDPHPVTSAPPALAAEPAPAPAAAPAPAVAEAPAALAVAPMDLAELKQLWPAVLSTLREQHQLLHGVIAPAVPVALDDHDLTLAYAPDQAFFRRRAETADHRSALAEIVRTLAGFQPTLRFELADPATLGADEPPEPVVSEAEWIERFKTEFDAEEIDEDPSTERTDD